MRHKIIQIVPCDNPGSSAVLIALCADGTVWEYLSKRQFNNMYKMVWEFVTDGPE